MVGKIIHSHSTITHESNETSISKQTGQLTISKRKQTAIIDILMFAKEKGHICYLLCFNEFDKRKFSKKEIIADLVTEGYVAESKIEQVLSHALLFLSDYNLLPLQKFIHSQYPDLQFVLVRANRTNFPTLRYNKSAK